MVRGAGGSGLRRLRPVQTTDEGGRTRLMATTINTQRELADLTPSFPPRVEETQTMHVRKRNGALEPVDVNKIVKAVQRSAYGLTHVDAIRIASKTIGGGVWAPGGCGEPGDGGVCADAPAEAEPCDR